MCRFIRVLAFRWLPLENACWLSLSFVQATAYAEVEQSG